MSPVALASTVAEVDMLRRSLELANRYVVADIKAAAALPGRRVMEVVVGAPTTLMPDGAVVRSPAEGQRRTYYDVSPMLDPRERSQAAIDMARQALAYALESGLAIADLPDHPELVRLHPHYA